jgi:hypothetical protein
MNLFQSHTEIRKLDMSRFTISSISKEVLRWSFKQGFSHEILLNLSQLEF